ncbi:quinon protein alcohol dehydrogenase-like superfamily [Dipodascopsis tothii]|uniref:quinon protein alcohol dehydrogenase-like superfamily n=1 Tax=Dipodascopsis tothii TaxID=44089 RepID=UPI0034CD8191
MYSGDYGKRVRTASSESSIVNEWGSDGGEVPVSASSTPASASVGSSTAASSTNTTLSSRSYTLGQHPSSPSQSPQRKRIRSTGFGDRYIPSREGNLQAGFSLMADGPSSPSRTPRRPAHNELDFQRKEEANRTFSTVLRSELFGDEVPAPAADATVATYDGSGARTPPRRASMSNAPSTPSRNLFSFMSPSPRKTPTRQIGSAILDAEHDVYSLSPVRFDSQRLLLSPRKQPRAIAKVPYKVLDAPDLADDFYLNLVDWGTSNVLGVGLGSCVYLWNAVTGSVSKLCDLGQNDHVTSVSWIQRGSHVAIGTNKGIVQIWDAEQQRKVRSMGGHSSRAGSLAWKEHILTSGSRDRTILHRDVRTPDHYIRRLTGHKQEICGLKWNCEDNQLASGGNDNKLFVWDKLNDSPLHKFSEHVAAVKAIAWSPHQRGILASGGGTADRRIKFWNTNTGQQINEIDTGSQICNLAWSKNSNELVSTHGYSQNQIVIWKYPSMRQVAALTGHTYRVLYLAMSPDGQTIVTGAGDETLRFWNVFGKGKAENKGSTLLDALQQIR